jgi:hypothetical protein
MKRFAISFVFLALLATAWISSNGARSSAAKTGVRRRGKMKFRFYHVSHLPAEAQAVLTARTAARQSRPGKGETDSRSKARASFKSPAT